MGPSQCAPAGLPGPGHDSQSQASSAQGRARHVLGTRAGVSLTCRPGRARRGVAGRAGHAPRTQPCPRALAGARGGRGAGGWGWWQGAREAIGHQLIGAWRSSSLRCREARAVGCHCKARDRALVLVAGHRGPAQGRDGAATRPLERRARSRRLEPSWLPVTSAPGATQQVDKCPVVQKGGGPGDPHVSVQGHEGFLRYRHGPARAALGRPGGGRTVGSQVFGEQRQVGPGWGAGCRAPRGPVRPLTR